MRAVKMKNKKILFISLGCDKNLVDSEVMLGILADRGFEMTDTEDDADIIIINTCCFINDAKEESINTILEMAEYKKTGPCKALIVTGCLAQRYKQEIVDEIPEVDAVIGTSKYDEIFDAVDQALKGSHFLDVDDLDRLPSVPGKRILTTGGHYAHLKIAEGCDKHCTYCIIPKIRGNYRSVPMEQLLAEAASLAEQGVKELILVAQETTLYGMDLYGKKSLHILLQELAKIKGIRWIRILYCYPEEIYPELIETIKNEKKVCHYLDMPIQHASDAILKRMGRRTTKAQLKETVSLLRKEIPDIVLRTTLIAGFPGETQEQHEELMEFVDEMEFERLGVFAYSPEENTPAASMPDQIPEEVKEERRDAILELQQEIAFDKAADMVGRTLYAMIEGKVADEPAYVARTYADSPDIDGYVFVNTGEMLMSGDFVKVKITGSAEYDLIGELV
jgi:ribosomal protein S12 methylthiotransferase